jgi:uncharacterized membrane protein
MQGTAYFIFLNPITYNRRRRMMKTPKTPAKPKVRSLKEIEREQKKLDEEKALARAAAAEKFLAKGFATKGLPKEQADPLKPYNDIIQNAQKKIKEIESRAQEEIKELRGKAINFIGEKYKNDPNKDKLPKIFHTTFN